MKRPPPGQAALRLRVRTARMRLVRVACTARRPRDVRVSTAPDHVVLRAAWIQLHGTIALTEDVETVGRAVGDKLGPRHVAAGGVWERPQQDRQQVLLLGSPFVEGELRLLANPVTTPDDGAHDLHEGRREPGGLDALEDEGAACAAGEVWCELDWKP